MEDNLEIPYSNPESNLHVFHFEKGEREIEVELFIRGSKTNKFTCDCKNFGKNKICAHIAAALLQLRKLKEKKERAKKSQKRKPALSLNQYNFRSILEQAQTEDLKNFIKSYAKKNKDFSLAFKVHFASKTDTGQEELKYKKLLDEAVKAKNSKHPNISRKEWMNLKLLLNDFLAQFEDGISQEQYKSSFIIFEKCMDKIAYVEHNYQKAQEKELIYIKTRFLEEFESMMSKTLAPELLIQIQERIVENATKSYYHPSEKNLLFSYEKKQKFSFDQTKELISNFIDKYKSGFDQDYKLAIVLHLSIEHGLEDMILETFNTLTILRHLELLRSTQKYDTIKKYLKLASIKKSDLIEKQMLELSILGKEKKHQKLLSLAEKISGANNQNQLVQIIKKYLPMDYVQINTKKCLSSFQKLGIRSQCQLLNFYGLHPELLKILKSESDLSLLVFYDQILIEKGYQKQIFELYKNILTIYLDQHIGLPSHDRIQSVLLHLSKIGAGGLRNKLRDYLVNEYPNRTTLKQIN